MLKKTINPTRRTIILFTALIAATAAFLAFIKKPAVISTNSPVGLINSIMTDEGRNRELTYRVWYPTNAIELVEMHGENAVFKGFPAILNAPLSTGDYPLIILSHGSGGNTANQGWLAIELARQGAIVVAANHPGSTSGDSAPETNITAWHRPEDITFILDQMLADPQFAPAIDPERIAVIGHSLGGYTALAVGGAELSLDQFIAYCDQYPNSPDCTFYREGEVHLTQVDRDQFEQAHRDDRVKAIIAIDPAYSRSFTDASTASIANTMLIAPAVSGSGMDNLHADLLAEQIGLGDSFIEIDGAHHFTWLPVCKRFGKQIVGIFERGSEVLCSAEEGQTRAAFHEETTDLIINYLQTQTILK